MADTPKNTEAPDDGLTRATFLTRATLGLGAVIGGLVTVPIAGLALAPAVTGKKFHPVSAGSIDEFEEGKYVKRVLKISEGEESADNPDWVRERVAFVRKNAPGFKDQLTGETGDEAKYTVISNRCAHLGCPVQQQGTAFVCPCHGGAYDADGGRTAGPPVRPLDRFKWREENGELMIVGEVSLTPDGKEVDIAGAGQHTGGPQGLFYPVQPNKFRKD